MKKSIHFQYFPAPHYSQNVLCLIFRHVNTSLMEISLPNHLENSTSTQHDASETSNHSFQLSSIVSNGNTSANDVFSMTSTEPRNNYIVNYNTVMHLNNSTNLSDTNHISVTQHSFTRVSRESISIHLHSLLEDECLSNSPTTGHETPDFLHRHSINIHNPELMSGENSWSIGGESSTHSNPHNVDISSTTQRVKTSRVLSNLRSLKQFSFLRKKTTDIPHIHLSLINASNQQDTLFFYASALEIDQHYSVIFIPISQKVHDFYRDSIQGVHLRIRILYHEKLDEFMRQWFLVRFKTQWYHLPQLRFTELMQQQQRQHRREILKLNVVNCDNTTCALNRDHLGQCDNGKYFFFSDVRIGPFDEIQYEVAKEGKCKGSIQMVLVTKRYGEIVLCETPLYSTGNWQRYQWQEAILGSKQRKFLKLFLRGTNHHRVEKVTLGFYFLGSYGICNIRSIRFVKYFSVESQQNMLSDKLFCDLVVN